jgi:hypothetical protein
MFEERREIAFRFVTNSRLDGEVEREILAVFFLGRHTLVELKEQWTAR